MKSKSNPAIDPKAIEAIKAWFKECIETPVAWIIFSLGSYLIIYVLYAFIIQVTR